MNKRKPPQKRQTRRAPRVSRAEQLSATELGERLGMTRQHVNRLVREGKLVHVRDSRFFDPADPTNAKYIAEHAKAAPVILPPLVTPPSAGPLPMGPQDLRSKSELDRLKSAEQLRKLELANERAAGSLVERASVFAFVGALVATLNNELLSIGQRSAPDISSVARGAESDDAATVAIEAFMSKELYSCIRSVTVSTRKFLRMLYGQSAGAAGPVELETALENVREMLGAVIAEVRVRKAAA